MSVEVTEPAVPDSDNQSQFIPELLSFPKFLEDISDAEVRSTKIITFETDSEDGRHTIDGKLFDDTIGQVVRLNTVEEWKIENRSTAFQIDHPFHIHINPFQVVEVFDPNELVEVNGKPMNKYMLNVREEDLPDPTIQCALNTDDPGTWKDCHNVKKSHRIWRDVFPIPSGRREDAFRSDGTPVTIPGYFRMRSRFVDYPGWYVMHCHILAHEDRGMMTVVHVAPFTPPVVHH